MKFFIVFLLVSIVCNQLHAQDSVDSTHKNIISSNSNLLNSNLQIETNLSLESNFDGDYNQWKYEKNYWIPAAGVVGINLAFGGFNKYVLDMSYAHINWESIKNNFKNGWVWDNDNFPVNKIGHPYQGGLYYTTAKYYGHGYLMSTAYTTFGSWQWEMFMETEPPAINDLITTSLGGPMMGEMLYHMSEKVLDDRSHGAERFFRELGAGLICPTLGLNRLIHGESFSSSPTRRRTDPTNNVAATFYFGEQFRMKQENDQDTTQVASGNLKMNMVYGNPYKVKKPFDFFLLDVGVTLNENIVADIRAQGVLWNTRLSFLEGKTLFGIFHNYDFIGSNLYLLGATSFGAGIGTFYPLTENGWFIGYNIQLNGIVMGGASTEYYFEYERDYNMGPGAGAKAIFAIEKLEFGRFRIKIDRYWIHTISGAKGDEFIGLATGELDKKLWNNFGLSIAYNIYDRVGSYQKNDPLKEDIDVYSHELKLFLTYHMD